MFKQVTLQSEAHEFVGFVTIPAFQHSPDILMWGGRFFARQYGGGGQPVTNGAVFREVFCVAVVPIPGIAKNDGTDPQAAVVT